MIIFPPCKINIGLQILSRRNDGYHNISSIFYPLPLTDVLEIITAKELSIHLTGLPVPGSPEDNLCLKAWHLLKNDFPGLPPVAIHLHKNIPIGAGLGGGSSDAANMLKLLNERYHLQLSGEKLKVYAAKLGSDCAFFIQDGACYVTGRGDELFPLKLEQLQSLHFLLVCPGIHVNTGEAYRKITPQIPAEPLPDIIQKSVHSWKGKVTNDFENPIFNQHPELASLKRKLYNLGALYASMSGSGSSIFGIFEKKVDVKAIAYEEGSVYSF